MNLIPEKHGDTPSYACTWNTQNFGRPDAPATDPAVFLGQLGARKARDWLAEEAIFGERGMARQFPGVRGELYFVVDDGWDVPRGVHPDRQIERFGSLELDEGRFPSCKGPPAERLTALNDRLKAAGWRGLGLWVAAQAAGEKHETGFFDGQTSAAYWRERLRWSARAGVGYWKVDWGCRQYDDGWRRMLCTLRDEEAPGLWIEHCSCPPAPVNHVRHENGRQVTDGRFAGWDDLPAQWARVMAYSDVFRSYDVLAQFSAVSTADRLASLLGAGGNCLVNCEDEVYLGAALGCGLGVMRSGLNGPIPGFDFDPQGVSRRLLEVDRAVNWQKIAPAFAAGGVPVRCSDELVTDAYTFAPGETWMEECVGQAITQSCPAVTTRGVEPAVAYGEAERPLVAASRHPNGALAAAVLPRRAGGGWRTPRAGLTLTNVPARTPVGLFGRWESVTLITPAGGRVWMQDLAKDAAEDVTERVVRAEGRVVIDGALLEAVCAGVDESHPGVAVRIDE